MTDTKKLVITASASAAVAVVLSVLFCGLLCCKCDKTAIVDVQQVVSHSKVVAEFKDAQAEKAKSLQEWVAAHNEEISKLTSDKEKEALAEKYREELAQKQQAYQDEDIAKLQEIDADITKLIAKIAKEAGYKKVFVKGTIISGGTDITEEVIEAMK